jgi:hypothetical protein
MNTNGLRMSNLLLTLLNESRCLSQDRPAFLIEFVFALAQPCNEREQCFVLLTESLVLAVQFANQACAVHL